MNKYEQCEKIFFRPILAFFVFLFVFINFKSCINYYISDIYLSKSFAVPSFLVSFSYNLFR